jgi:hypothetical protein
MKLKPVPKAILIASVVGGVAYAGYIFTGDKPQVQAAPVVQQAPAVQDLPVAPVQQPAPAPVQQPAHEVRQDMSANRGMSALMNAGKK